MPWSRSLAGPEPLASLIPKDTGPALALAAPCRTRTGRRRRTRRGGSARRAGLRLPSILGGWNGGRHHERSWERCSRGAARGGPGLPWVVSFDIHVSDTFDQKPTLTGPSVPPRSVTLSRAAHDSSDHVLGTSRACTRRPVAVLGKTLDNGWEAAGRPSVVCRKLLTFVRLAQQTGRHACVARRPDRLRWRLQPRAVAARRLGRRHAPHARGGRQLRHPRRLLVVLARALQGRVHLRVARRDHGPAARPRHRRRPRHRDGHAAALADLGLPGDPARRPRRPHPVARQPPGLVPVVAALPRAGAGPHRPSRRAVPRPPGPGDVARLERVRVPQPALLLRHLRRRLPPLARAPIHHPRRAQRRLGHRLLEPALHVLGRRPPAAAHDDVQQPHPRARLPPLRLRHPARLLPRRARGDPPPLPRRAGHHELHDAEPLPAARLPRLGAVPGRREHRPLRRRRAGATRVPSCPSPAT